MSLVMRGRVGQRNAWILDVCGAFAAFFNGTMPLLASVTLLVLVLELKFMEVLSLHLEEVLVLIASLLDFPSSLVQTTIAYNSKSVSDICMLLPLNSISIYIEISSLLKL